MSRSLFAGLTTALLLSILSGGCSRTRGSETRNYLLDAEAADAVIVRYIRIRPDNSFYFTLSRETAATLGIADDDYDRALDVVAFSNDYLQSLYVENPNLRLFFGFPVPPQLPRIPDYSK